MMKLPYISLLFVFLLGSSLTAAADPIDNIAELIKQHNIHELSRMFSQSIEMSILGDENIYSKTQAELILEKFFTDNKVRSVKMLHRVNSNPNYHFGVITVNTDKGAYRVACTLKQTDGALMLIEIRIEAEKVK